MISVTNLRKVYGKKQSEFIALDDVSLEIPSGKSVAIVGKSGSGKSTLMHIMSGLDRPTSGTITVDKRNIASLSAREIDRFRASSIGFIFQAFFVEANETCYQNVVLPLEILGTPQKERHELVKRALEQVDLVEKIDTKAGNLSGGQKQRLAIARAIVHEPKVIFADEPTGNLDSATSEMIEDLLFSYNKKKKSTLIIVTHDDDLAKRCDMQVRIKDGNIMSDAKKKGVKQ